MTEVDVELKSGDCSVTFMADGLIDADGRYLITETSVEATRLCPGYPMGISGIDFEQDREAPFGTIEVQRESASWRTCIAGQLILRPDVTVTLGEQDVAFTGTELRFSGMLDQTHHDPSGDCPAVYP